MFILFILECTGASVVLSGERIVGRPNFNLKDIGLSYRNKLCVVAVLFIVILIGKQ